jgi:hypothetical protein
MSVRPVIDVGSAAVDGAPRPGPLVGRLTAGAHRSSFWESDAGDESAIPVIFKFQDLLE